jgi:hypothetical protein
VEICAAGLRGDRGARVDGAADGLVPEESAKAALEESKVNGEADTRTTDQIVADVCAALSVERVEIRPAPTETTRQIVRTAPFRYRGSDRLDITRKSAGPDGIAFAPTWEILRVVLDARRSGDAKAYEATREWYAQSYTAEMRVSFGAVPGSKWWDSMSSAEQHDIRFAMQRGVVPNPPAWAALLARREVTLVCYCPTPDRCHRTLLARILERLGARYLGETS